MASSNPIPLNTVSITDRERIYLERALEDAHLSGDGQFTKACTALLRQLTGADAVLMTHSCTAALEMAALLADVSVGDEVIMPSYTFVSTANAVVLRGATPVFVDVEPDTLNIDPECVRAAITQNTKAIFAVHYAGLPADMTALTDLAKANDLLLVEDAAQALGSHHNGKPAGSLGDLAAFSFHATKNIVSGEGGALTINKNTLIERAEILRDKGTNRRKFLDGDVDKYTWVDIGSSYLPGELTCAFLLAQLERYESINSAKRVLAARYRTAFADFAKQGRIQLPHPAVETAGNAHIFYLLLENPADRDKFINVMRQAKIQTPFHYVPLHLAPAGQKYARSHGDLSVTNDRSARLVRLPIYPDMTLETQDHVIAVAKSYLSGE